GFIEERDLVELMELQDVVLEDLILLPRFETGVLEIGGERLQDLRVGDDVPANLFSRPGGDVLIAGDDRFAGAALQGYDVCDAVRDERRDGRQRQQQREADGDAADREAHGSVSAGVSLVSRAFPEANGA